MVPGVEISDPRSLKAFVVPKVKAAITELEAESRGDDRSSFVELTEVHRILTSAWCMEDETKFMFDFAPNKKANTVLRKLVTDKMGHKEPTAAYGACLEELTLLRQITKREETDPRVLNWGTAFLNTLLDAIDEFCDEKRTRPIAGSRGNGHAVSEFEHIKTVRTAIAEAKNGGSVQNIEAAFDALVRYLSAERDRHASTVR